MTAPDDDSSDMDITRRGSALSDSDVEALLAGRAVPAHPDLQDLIALMRTAAAVPAPAPSAALDAVLATGFDPLPVGPDVEPRRWRRRAGGMTLAVVAAMTVTGAAAAANALPATVQSVVADAVEAVTPFDVPRPERPSGGEEAPGADVPAGAEWTPSIGGPGAGDSPDPAPAQLPQSGASPRLPVPAPDDDPDDHEQRGEDDADAPDDGDGEADQSGSDEPEADATGADEPEDVDPDGDESDAPGADEPDSGDSDSGDSDSADSDSAETAGSDPDEAKSP